MYYIESVYFYFPSLRKLKERFTVLVSKAERQNSLKKMKNISTNKKNASANTTK